MKNGFRKSSFRKRADMLVLPLRSAVNVSPTEGRWWERYDSPSWKRLGYPDPSKCSRLINRPLSLPALLTRQAS